MKRHGAPFVAFGSPLGAFGGHFWSLSDISDFSEPFDNFKVFVEFFVILLTFSSFLIIYRSIVFFVLSLLRQDRLNVTFPQTLEIRNRTSR